MIPRLLARLSRPACLLVTSLLPAVAFAADPPGPDEGQAQQVPSDLLISDWKLGPFYAKASFALENVGWDNNVYLSPEGREQKDFTATVAPGLRLALPFGDNAFSVREKLGYVWFKDAASERGLDSDTEIKLDLVNGPVRLAVAETFRSTRERFEADIFSRPRRIENRFDAVAGTDRDSGVYFEGNFGLNLVRFSTSDTTTSSDLSHDLDRTELRGGLAAFLDVADAARIIVGGEVATDRFRFDPAAKDADGAFLFSGLRFEPGHVATGDIRVGYQKLNVKREDHPDFSGLALRSDLLLELGDAGKLRLEASREPVFSSFETNVYFSQTRLHALLNLPAGDRFEIEAGPLWVKVDYPVAEPIATGALVKREDTVTWWEAAGVIHLTEDVGFRVGVIHRHLDSNFPGIGYSNFVFVTGLRYGL